MVAGGDGVRRRQRVARCWAFTVAFAFALAGVGSPSVVATTSDELVAAACPAGVAGEADFVDVMDDDVHAAAIDCAGWWGVVRGTGYDTFEPDGHVTRGQIATFLARLLHRSDFDLPTASDAFDDDTGHAHEININVMAAAGIVHGTGPRTYRPGAALTRAQTASILLRAYQLRTGAVLPAAGVDRFVDIAESAHRDSINRAAAAGIVAGTDDRRFDPQGAIRRDQMASVLVRFLGRLVSTDVVAAPVVEPDPGAEPVPDEVPVVTVPDEGTVPEPLCAPVPLPFIPADSGLYLLDLDAGEATRLALPDWVDPHFVEFVPDGSRLVFNATDSSDDTYDGDLFDLYTMNVDGTGLREIGDIRSPGSITLSPDGQRLAFYAFEEPTHTDKVWVSDAEGRNPVPLATFTDGGTFIEWSPDSTRIAFGVDPSSRPTAYVVDVTTGVKQVIARGHVSGLSWSPDGSELGYGLWGSAGGFLVRADGTDTRQLDSSSADVMWSWIDDLLALVRPEGTSVASPDGSNERFVTALRAQMWSPTGGRFTAASVLGLHVVDIDGCSRLVASSTNEHWVGGRAWSPDGRTLVVDVHRAHPPIL